MGHPWWVKLWDTAAGSELLALAEEQHPLPPGYRRIAEADRPVIGPKLGRLGQRKRRANRCRAAIW